MKTIPATDVRHGMTVVKEGDYTFRVTAIKPYANGRILLTGTDAFGYPTSLITSRFAIVEVQS